MSIVYVMRHAQSQGNANPSLYGTMLNQDIPLSDQGIIEALDTGVKLREHLDEDKKRPYQSLDPKAAGLFQFADSAFALFSSPYKRAVQTAEIVGKQIGIQKTTQNILLSERQYGEEEGSCNVDNFQARPMERKAYQTAGHLWYSPHRGESLMDLYMRVTLFFLQQSRFEYIPVSIIASHMSTCQMFHALFTNEMPTPITTDIPQKERSASGWWNNSEVRKYAVISGTTKYLGTV